VREARTPCLRQFTKGLEAPSFSLFERIFAIRRISVAKSRKLVEIACTVFRASTFRPRNATSTQRNISLPSTRWRFGWRSKRPSGHPRGTALVLIPVLRADSASRSGRRKINALSFYSLRRTATTLLHEAGVPSTVAQALIGHDSEEVHSDYITLGREALRNAANRFPTL